jgi:hypothetical protein
MLQSRIAFGYTQPVLGDPAVYRAATPARFAVGRGRAVVGLSYSGLAARWADGLELIEAR